MQWNNPRSNLVCIYYVPGTIPNVFLLLKFCYSKQILSSPFTDLKKNIEAQRLNQCLKFKQLVKDKVRIWTLVIWLWDLYTYISMPIWRLKHADRPTLEASVVSSDNNSLSPLGTVPQINPALSYPHFSVHALFSVEIFFPYAFTCQNL